MYCPNCSTEASTEQKFCRSCGMELQAVSQLIAGQSELQRPAELSSPDKPARDRRNKLAMYGTMIVMSSLVVGSLLLVFAGLNKFYPGMSDLIPLVLGVSGVLLFSGAALIVYSTFLPKESTSSNPSMPESRAQKGATTKQQINLLPETLMSVTDHTTELFEAVDAKNPPRNTAPQSE